MDLAERDLDFSLDFSIRLFCIYCIFFLCWSKAYFYSFLSFIFSNKSISYLISSYLVMLLWKSLISFSSSSSMALFLIWASFLTCRSPLSFSTLNSCSYVFYFYYSFFNFSKSCSLSFFSSRLRRSASFNSMFCRRYFSLTSSSF